MQVFLYFQYAYHIYFCHFFCRKITGLVVPKYNSSSRERELYPFFLGGKMQSGTGATEAGLTAQQ